MQGRAVTGHYTAATACQGKRMQGRVEPTPEVIGRDSELTSLRGLVAADRAAQGHHRGLADVLRRPPADRRSRLSAQVGPCQRVRGRLGGHAWLDPLVLDTCYAPLLPDVPMRIGIIRCERGAGHPKKHRSGAWHRADHPVFRIPGDPQITGNYPK